MNIVSMSYKHANHQGNHFKIFLGILTQKVCITWMSRTSLTSCWMWQMYLTLKRCHNLQWMGQMLFGICFRRYIKSTRKMNILWPSTLEVVGYIESMVLSKLDSKAKIGTLTRYFMPCTTCSVTAWQDVRYTYVTPSSLHMSKFFVSLQFS